MGEILPEVGIEFGKPLYCNSMRVKVGESSTLTTRISSPWDDRWHDVRRMSRTVIDGLLCLYELIINPERVPSIRIPIESRKVAT